MDLPSPQHTDEFSALVARVRTGDELALLQLLQRYEHRVRAAARRQLGRLLRPHVDSLDIVQSVYCTLLPHLRQGKYDFSSSEDLIAMALTVLRRKIARSWQRLRKERELAGQSGIPDTGETQPRRDAARHNPAETAMVNDQIRSMTAGLCALDRSLVELRLQGYRTVEIAEKLHCNAAVLRARLSRLRQQLRQSGHAERL
jgi:RNA polymerase sigma-70 factor (ECF subfamily)